MILKQMNKTEFEERLSLAKTANKVMVPIYLEITEDMMTPVLAFLTLRRPGLPAFLFESVIGGEHTARWSYLGFNPFRVFTCKGQGVTVCDHQRQILKSETGDPKKIMPEELAKYSLLPAPGLPPFCGGLVGNIGYDAVRLVEPSVPDKNRDDLNLPDITMMYFDAVIAFDHVFKKIYLIRLVPVYNDPEKSFDLAVAGLKELHEQLLRPRYLDLLPGSGSNSVSSNMTPAEFEAMVRRAKDYIEAGDVVQTVVSQRFSCPITADPFVVYRCLRHTNPSPYLFFVDFGQWQLIGSSPEIMVKVEAGKISINPIAGTRPRGKTPEEDARLETELLQDEKERAEHIMLVDLARNDVGRVAEFGSVTVPPNRIMFIERYSTVMHLVSEVTGKLKAGVAPLEALWASLPAGTLSGAPKVRAMQIIDELETTRRGPYGGCVGFLGFDGNIETAIVIRTAVAVGGQVYWQAGSGIVYDSVPETEYQESCNKGRSILGALIMAGNTKGGNLR